MDNSHQSLGYVQFHFPPLELVLHDSVLVLLGLVMVMLMWVADLTPVPKMSLEEIIVVMKIMVL